MRIEVSMADCWNRGDSRNTRAAARKAAVFTSTGIRSDVLVTIGPMPKLMKSVPHSGENSSSQIHFLRTIPAAARNQSSVRHAQLPVTYGACPRPLGSCKAPTEQSLQKHERFSALQPKAYKIMVVL